MAYVIATLMAAAYAGLTHNPQPDAVSPGLAVSVVPAAALAPGLAEVSAAALAVVSLAGIWSVVKFVLAFSLIIFVHELGHFAVAKYFNVEVLQFSIGMPPRLVGFKWGETDYCLGCLPIGGYVLMTGQSDVGSADPQDTSTPEGKAAAAATANPRAFVNQSTIAKVAILSAGVIMNLIFGFAVFGAVFLSGQYRQPGTRVGELLADHPTAIAADAGQPTIQPGDVIIAVGGNSVSDFTELFVESLLADRDAPLEVTVRRGEQNLTVSLPGGAETLSADGRRLLGFVPALSTTVPANLVEVDPNGLAPGETVVAAITTDTSVATKETDRLTTRTIRHFPDLRLALIESVGRPLTLQLRDDRSHADTVSQAPIREVVVTPSVLPPRQLSERVGYLLDGLLPPLRLDEVTPDSPAAQAGLKVGDVILNIGEVARPNTVDFLKAVKDSQDKPLSVKIRRGQQTQTVTVTPVSTGQDQRPQIGVTLGLDYSGPVELANVPSHWELTRAGIRALAAEGLDPQVVGLLRRAVVMLSANSPQKLREGLAEMAESAGPSLSEAQLDTIAKRFEQSRAARAGFAAGDVITRFDGQPIGSWNDLAAAIWRAAPETTARGELGYPVTRQVSVTVNRDGPDSQGRQTTLTADVLARPYEMSYLPVGIPTAWEVERFVIRADSLGQAIGMGLHKTLYMIKQVYATLGGMFTSQVSLKSISGPVGIVSVGSQVARQDTWHMWYLLAAISVNLAVINFLPLPVLDGGHITLLLVEKIRGRPLPVWVSNLIIYIGLLLILSLFVTVTFNDIRRLVMGP